MEFEKGGANGFTVSADGHRLLSSQVDRNESDIMIMLLENFR